MFKKNKTMYCFVYLNNALCVFFSFVKTMIRTSTSLEILISQRQKREKILFLTIIDV